MQDFATWCAHLRGGPLPPPRAVQGVGVPHVKMQPFYNSLLAQPPAVKQSKSDSSLNDLPAPFHELRSYSPESDDGGLLFYKAGESSSPLAALERKSRARATGPALIASTSVAERWLGKGKERTVPRPYKRQRIERSPSVISIHTDDSSDIESDAMTSVVSTRLAKGKGKVLSGSRKRQRKERSSSVISIHSDDSIPLEYDSLTSTVGKGRLDKGKGKDQKVLSKPCKCQRTERSSSVISIHSDDS